MEVDAFECLVESSLMEETFKSFLIIGNPAWLHMCKLLSAANKGLKLALL